MFSLDSIQIINKIFKNTNCIVNNFLIKQYSHINYRSLNLNFQNSKFYSTSTNGPSKENPNWRKRVIGAQSGNRLNVGPYKRGRWFVSFKEDPGSFITNVLIIIVTGYAIFTLLPGESMKVRRQRKLRQMLLDKANLTEAELSYIENYKLSTDNEQNSK